ncbi:MAG: hypothetical protein AAGF23_08415 [Acidobacteriota bacterium]
MAERSPRRAAWTLDPESLGRFLLLLDDDVKRAAERYERVRTRLIRLFEWRGAVFAEDLADETLNRVIRKVEEGAPVSREAVGRYAAGVAHRVFLEHLRETRRKSPAPPESTRPPWVARGRETTDFRLHHLERGLQALAAEERSLILRYYAGGPRGRIAERRRLAEDLGIRANHLRIRAYRIRAKLEGWISQHADRREVPR